MNYYNNYNALEDDIFHLSSDTVTDWLKYSMYYSNLEPEVRFLGEFCIFQNPLLFFQKIRYIK